MAKVPGQPAYKRGENPRSLSNLKCPYPLLSYGEEAGIVRVRTSRRILDRLDKLTPRQRGELLYQALGLLDEDRIRLSL